jgi:hypothetical protein
MLSGTYLLRRFQLRQVSPLGKIDFGGELRRLGEKSVHHGFLPEYSKRSFSIAWSCAALFNP